MLSNIRISRLGLAFSRQLQTTSIQNFKFKFTEDMAREQEKKMKIKEEEDAKKQPEQAITTKETTLLMGRVSDDRYKSVVKIGVPKHRLNEYFLMYIREQDSVYALDENNIAKPGDWVLIRKKTDIPDKKVTHIVDKVIYKMGNLVDPLTNKRSLGLYYDEDYRELEKIKLDL